MSAAIIDLRLHRAPRPVPSQASAATPALRPVPVPHGRAAPLANAGVAFEAWVEANAARIWNLLVRSNRRDVTFNDFAAELWEIL